MAERPSKAKKALPNVHSAIKRILRFYEYDHLPANMQATSKKFHDLAWDMAEQMPEDPETTRGLTKLLEAKDCFVRAMIPFEE